MPRYWAIAPSSSDDPDLYDAVWNYDLANGIISIGWRELGDISSLDDVQIRERLYKELPAYKQKPGAATTAARMLHKFYHVIAPGDVIFARWGLKMIAGVGTVKRTAYYDPDKLLPVFEQFGPEYAAMAHPNFIDVEWREDMRDEEYEDRVFGLTTLHEIAEDKARELLEDDERPIPPGNNPQEAERSTNFALERYLEDFIVSNFSTVFQGKLEILTDPVEGIIGQQYSTDVGVIDILAQDASTGDFVVIELKRGKAADKVVGQVLRYMGWVAESLCDKNQHVSGLIICGEPDEKLDYALKMLSNVSVKYYRVDFRLHD